MWVTPSLIATLGHRNRGRKIRGAVVNAVNQVVVDINHECTIHDLTTLPELRHSRLRGSERFHSMAD